MLQWLIGHRIYYCYYYWAVVLYSTVVLYCSQMLRFLPARLLLQESNVRREGLLSLRARWNGAAHARRRNKDPEHTGVASDCCALVVELRWGGRDVCLLPGVPTVHSSIMVTASKLHPQGCEASLPLVVDSRPTVLVLSDSLQVHTI